MDSRTGKGKDSENKQTLLSVTKDRKLWSDVIPHVMKGYNIKDSLSLIFQLGSKLGILYKII